jgi:hypothetical protein
MVASTMNNHESFASLLLANRCEVPMTEADYADVKARFGIDRASVRATKDHEGWNNLYYGIKPKQARKHLAALAKDFPAQAALFAHAVETMLADLAQAEIARAAAKAEKQARKDARAAKAAQKANLGIDLAKKEFEFATVATYTALRTGLAEIETAICAHLEIRFTKAFETMLAELTANGMNLAATFPCRNRRTGEIMPNQSDLPANFHKHFNRGIAFATVKPNVATIITADARRDAAEMMAGFCGKLAGKIDRELCNADKNAADRGTVLSVRCTGALWENSTLTVETTEGTQIWHTKMILNVSGLGKIYNQWPTNRVA